MAHTLVKPQKLVDFGAGIVEKELILPKLVIHETLDQFKGAQGDTVTYRLPGHLPGRDYAFRNDRTNEIVFDELAETTINVTLSGNAYSAVYVTDEQMDFDLLGSFGRVLEPQCRGVASKLNHAVADAIEGASFPVVLNGGTAGGLREQLIEARRVLGVLGNDLGGLVLVVGSGFESALLKDNTLNLAQNVGDGLAEDALRNAVIGKRIGFTIVVDQTIAADSAYAFASDAFILATGVPSVPQSVGTGATTSYGGFTLRWLKDYDLNRLRDRSVVNTYYGIRPVVDTLRIWDSAANPKVEKFTTSQHFIRAIKLTLAGTVASSVYPTAGTPLQLATGLVKPA